MNVVKISRRNFTTSLCLCGVKSRNPFDKRFPVKGRHVSEVKPGGSKIMRLKTRTDDVQPTGYVSKRTYMFEKKKEMIPEFIVPDLTGFELKAYVPYNVEEVKQKRLTAKSLFNSCYAERIIKDYRSGKMTSEEIDLILERTPKADKG